MAFALPLPRPLAKAGWKVKIRDKERLEEPHVTIMRGTRCWRLGLRSRTFLDPGDSWGDIPERPRQHVTAELNWKRLGQEWDRMYPDNRVTAAEGENGGED